MIQVAKLLLYSVCAVGALVTLTAIILPAKQPSNKFLEDSKTGSQKDTIASRDLRLKDGFENRRRHTSKTCLAKIGYYGNATDKLPNESAVFEYSFFDEQFKIIFCTIPKVASTHWKKLLFEATLNGNASEVKNHPSGFMERTMNVFRDTRTELFRKLTKVVFVRNPLERLISAWRNRFLPPKTSVYEEIAEHIVAKYRNKTLNGTGVMTKESNFVTLEEFFRFLVVEGSKPGKWDDLHWRSQVRLCEPCQVGYDFIGRFENLEEESAFVTNHFFDQKNLKLQAPVEGSFAFDRKQAKLPYVTPTLYYASTVPAHLLNQVIDAYADDFDMFGYPRINYSSE